MLSRLSRIIALSEGLLVDILAQLFILFGVYDLTRFQLGLRLFPRRVVRTVILEVA